MQMCVLNQQYILIFLLEFLTKTINIYRLTSRKSKLFSCYESHVLSYMSDVNLHILVHQLMYRIMYYVLMVIQPYYAYIKHHLSIHGLIANICMYI